MKAINYSSAVGSCSLLQGPVGNSKSYEIVYIDLKMTTTEDLSELHLKYIKTIVVPKIVSEFENEEFKTIEIEKSTGLDGFMSALYTIRLKTVPTETKSSNIKERLLIAKFMKGDEAFRESSKSYIQFANEIFIYAKVLPAYKELLTQANVTDVSVEDWVAHCYMAKFGCIDGLSVTNTTRESVLVLDNLKHQGYTLGPRLYLRRDHLLEMAKVLGQYHAMSYALRYQNESKFESLHNEIIPLPFIKPEDPDDAKRNFYTVLYRVAFDRFFEYFERVVGETPKPNEMNSDEVKFIKNVRRLKEKYFEQPTQLMQWVHKSIENDEKDKRFGVILHGDFNRNNVMFRYKDCNDQQSVEDVKLIDFQELRYGTPAMDLSFFMYFNTPEEMRNEIWMEILKWYHLHMHQTLTTVLNGLKSKSGDDVKISEYLKQYNFENLNAHFSRYAFYGVMICLHFLPWCFSSEEECSKLSHYFETDMHGEEFYKISMTAGGDEANKRILDIVRHASKMGYMDQF